MSQESENQNCVFCLIASEKLESYKISEIQEAIAVLELNPVSKGHTMVLPKEHLQLKEMKSKIVLFAQKLAAQLKEKLNSKDIEIATVDFQGHGIINLIPVYNEENIESKRYKATLEELQEVQSLFVDKPEVKNEIEKPAEKEVKKVPEKDEDKKEKESKLEKQEETDKKQQEPAEKHSEPEKKIWFPRRIP
ncbi:MAG TPA: HIT domain-containing protein [Candidatus Pacearchaeota archaeon]|nr:HIT domain-containing protein [Candidatus Pacearchaeota archaeon]